MLIGASDVARRVRARVKNPPRSAFRVATPLEKAAIDAVARRKRAAAAEPPPSRAAGSWSRDTIPLPARFAPGDDLDPATRLFRAAGGLTEAGHSQLDRLAAICAATHALDELRDGVARSAYRAGATWAEIGEALGVSMQAAQRRFGAKRGAS